MIIEDETFIHLLPEEPVTDYTSVNEYLQHKGKWLIYAEQESIEKMVGKVKDLIGKNGISEAKFTKRPALQVPEGYRLGVDYVMIVYCDDRNRSEVRKVLEKQLDATEMLWKYDRETWLESLNSREKIPDEIQVALEKLRRL